MTAVPNPPLIEPEFETSVTVVTGLEGPVELTTPVTCSYCGNSILTRDDHAANCAWRRGKAPVR